jgi:hypothetical protein
MGTIDVALGPPVTGAGKREYLDKHELNVSKQSHAGEDKIKFTADTYSFVIIIPRAENLFTDPAEKTLHFRLEHGTTQETPIINTNVTKGEKYEYHVFCEDERDWAHKPGSSPPKIIIID